MNTNMDELLKESRTLREESEAVLRVNGVSYDLSEWLTIKEYVKRYRLSGTNVVSNWIERGVIPKGDYIEISELNSLKLIRNQPYR